MPLKLDTTRLNLVDEIKAKISGTATYQAHRTAKSFEVTPRTIGYIKASNPVVLATHKCPLLYGQGEPAVDFWGRDEVKQISESTEVPF